MLLEHDRGTEREQAFKRKIAAYRALLQSGAFKEQYNVGNITILFTTFTDMKRVAELRKWTWDEVQNDQTVYGRFRFTRLPSSPEPRHLLFEPRWCTLVSDQPVALLGE